MNKFFIVFLVLTFTSCSSTKSSSSSLPSYKKKYLLSDKSGKFTVVLESGRSSSSKDYLSRREVYNHNDEDGKVLEKSIVLSTPGYLGKKLPILRPRASQYTVWFDKKQYTTMTKVDLKKKALVVSMKSPESQWNGSKTITFPRGNGVFCYFSQIIECAGQTGYIAKAVEKKAGKMSFHIIWEGYPYVMEQYLNLPRQLFSRASLSYDGTTKNKEKRFTLKVGGQSIFYFLNDNLKLVKKFWVSQGLTMVEEP